MYICMCVCIGICIQHFKKLLAIGKGGFGKVWKVQKRNNGKGVFALKEMSKAKIFHKKSLHLIQNERIFLEKLNFPLLTNMHYAFETNDYLYIVMDYLSGGDLRYHLCKGINYTETQILFIIANIILSLQYIHSKRIFHRDIKPENLVFDSKGYLHLTDFGIAHEYQLDEDIIDTSGTPSYMAPEALLKKPHSFIVDFFSLGVLTYELMFGERPYAGRTKKEIREQVVSKEIVIKDEDLPKGWCNRNVIDFVNGLLKRKPYERLGKDGVKDVMTHSWLKDVDWNGIKCFNAKSPVSIYGDENFNEKYVNNKDVVSYGKETQEYYVSVVNANKCFCKFYFNRNDNKPKGRGKKILSKSNSLPQYSYLTNTKRNSIDKGNVVVVYSNKDVISNYVNDEHNKKENKDEISEAKSISIREVSQEGSNKLKM